ncbi:Uncharacterised protein [Mycobacteroides abscessus subsp. abscessus]|nr:Uncharacterised protein [Mycobacteroides abscessus subsp. abscessus]
MCARPGEFFTHGEAVDLFEHSQICQHVEILVLPVSSL